MNDPAVNPNKAASPRPSRWLVAVAAAGALIAWQVVRHGRARLRKRWMQHDLHRWEGEGGQVLD